MSLLRRRTKSRSCHIHGDNGCEIQGEAGPRERAQDKRDWRTDVDEDYDRYAIVRHFDGDEAAERVKRSHEEYKTWETKLRAESVKADGKNGSPLIYVQWKATDVSGDFHCPCGTWLDLDGRFLYSVQCPSCERVWELDHTLLVREVRDGEEPRSEPVELGYA